MILNGVEIEDTYCEAFGGFFSRILVTAINEKWAKIAGQIATGYATSTIHCDAEAAIDVVVPPGPGDRPAVGGGPVLHVVVGGVVHRPLGFDDDRRGRRKDLDRYRHGGLAPRPCRPGGACGPSRRRC